MRGFNYVITDIEINWTKEHIIQKENESFRIALYMVQISSRYKDAYIVNIGFLRTSNGNIKYLKIAGKQACVLFNEIRNFKKNSLKIVYLLHFCCLLVWYDFCLFVLSLSSHSSFSFIWRRHYCQWRAAKFDLCSALMAIEQWGFFKCHTICDTGLPFIMVISEDQWDSNLLSVWQKISIPYFNLLLIKKTYPDKKLIHLFKIVKLYLKTIFFSAYFQKVKTNRVPLKDVSHLINIW